MSAVTAARLLSRPLASGTRALSRSPSLCADGMCASTADLLSGSRLPSEHDKVLALIKNEGRKLKLETAFSDSDLMRPASEPSGGSGGGSGQGWKSPDNALARLAQLDLRDAETPAEARFVADLGSAHAHRRAAMLPVPLASLPVEEPEDAGRLTEAEPTSNATDSEAPWGPWVRHDLREPPESEFWRGKGL